MTNVSDDLSISGRCCWQCESGVKCWRMEEGGPFVCVCAEILKVVCAVNTLVLFFALAVLIFGLCTRTGCELVLFFGSSCANVWPKQFGQLTQRCLVSGN